MKRLEKELLYFLERAALSPKRDLIFDGFFTKTEKIMFAKRLAVIYMLHRKVSPYMIAESLFMSPSTIERMSLKYEKGRYEPIIKKALGKKNIWDILESILYARGIMPPKFGGKRWQMLDKTVHRKN